MTYEDTKRCENLNRTSGTMEAIRRIQRRIEENKKGILSKDNLRGARKQGTSRKREKKMMEGQESSDEVRPRGRKLLGFGLRFQHQGGTKQQILSAPRLVR